jgi:hypothetical protein
MMQSLVKTLLGLGITVGLSDRETFVKEVSILIQDYQKDPAKADKWAKAAIAYLERVNENMNVQDAVKSVMSGQPAASKEEIEKLTTAIEELTKELQKQKDRK